jgi:hypothetical protein
MSPLLSVDVADIAADDESTLDAGGNVFNELAHRIGLTAQQPLGNYVGIRTDTYFLTRQYYFNKDYTILSTT